MQMGDRLDLQRFQINRALAAGLIPAPDRAGGRWSAAVVDEVAGRVEDIRDAVGSMPDLGAGRAATLLGERLGCEVHPDTIAELAATGLVPIVGDYKGWPLYCGRALEEFADVLAIQHAARTGKLHTADQAAEYMRIRRSDFDHLTRAGLLTPVTLVHGPFQSRSSAPKVPLYRAGDMDDLLNDTGIDWEAVRATPAGFHSELAKLPTKETR